MSTEPQRFAIGISHHVQQTAESESGEFRTQSNSAIQKYMNAKKVPQLFVASGATKWGDPQTFPWTIGWQPNYQSDPCRFLETQGTVRPDDTARRSMAAAYLHHHFSVCVSILWRPD